MKTVMLLAALAALAGCQRGAPDNESDANNALPADEAIKVGNDTDPDRTPPKTPSGRVSRYTSLGKDNCKLVEESDEGPYWRMRCGGVGGYSVDYTESDLRQNLAVLEPGGATTSLDLPSRVAKGAFDRLGTTIEWRGPAGERPDVLVIRVHVANDQGEDDPGRLAVARLMPTPCVTAVIPPGAGQSDKARLAADTPGACLP